MKDILSRGNWRRAARHLSTIWKARGLLLGDCEAILRKDTWAAPVKLRKLRRGELRMMPRGEGGGEPPRGAAGTHIFQLSPAWEMHITCNIFEQNCILQSCILRFSSA